MSNLQIFMKDHYDIFWYVILNIMALTYLSTLKLRVSELGRRNLVYYNSSLSFPKIFVI